MSEIYGKAFGNLLSAYWSCRAYSIYKQSDFKFSIYMKIGNKYHDSVNSINKNLFKFFPLNIKFSEKYKIYNNSFNNCISITDEYSITNFKSNNYDIDDFFENKENRLFLYFSHMYLGAWDNIIEVIQEESNSNIINYLKNINTNFPIYEQNEIVIHFRCGNVLSGHTHPDYYLLKFKYFKDNIDNNCKKITIIWKIDYQDKNTKKETGRYGRDLFVISELKKYLELNLNIEVNIHNSYFSDLIYMIYAPKLIITPSSFSFWPCIMSKHISIVPKCALLCGNRTPKLKKNLYWKDIDDYKISAHKLFETRNDDQEILKELLNI